MDWGDIFTGTVGGAGAGAAAGSFFPGYGNLIGAGIGGIGGLISGISKSRGKDKQKRSMGQARVQLEELARKQRETRAADLQKAMSYFGPVEEEMKRLYG